MPLALAVSTEPTAADRLADLKKQRAPLAAESHRISEIRGRLAEAEKAERDALAAIGVLGDAEIAEMSKWASAGCAGDPPQADMKRREQLARQLAAAQAATLASRGAGAGFDERGRELAEKIAANERAIDFAAAETLAEEIASDHQRLEQRAAEVSHGIARMAALRMFLSETGRSRTDRSGLEIGRPFFSLAEHISAQSAISTLPTNAMVSAEIETVRKQFASYRGE